MLFNFFSLAIVRWGKSVLINLHFWYDVWRRKVIIKQLKDIKAIAWCEVILVWCHQSHAALCFCFFWTKCAAHSGQRWENNGCVCSHYHFRPHHHPSHHISILTITCVWVCISSFHLLNTHDYTAVLVTPNFCFPNYVCYSCLSVEKESRWISAFIITPISPWALIKSQLVWCSFFLPLLFQNTTPLRVLIRRGQSIRWH